MDRYRAGVRCAQVEVDGGAVTVLKKGSYFGEVGLLRNCRRTASIRALSETCDLFVLSKVEPEMPQPNAPSARGVSGAALHRIPLIRPARVWWPEHHL